MIEMSRREWNTVERDVAGLEGLTGAGERIAVGSVIAAGAADPATASDGIDMEMTSIKNKGQVTFPRSIGTTPGDSARVAPLNAPNHERAAAQPLSYCAPSVATVAPHATRSVAIFVFWIGSLLGGIVSVGWTMGFDLSGNKDISANDALALACGAVAIVSVANTIGFLRVAFTTTVTTQMARRYYVVCGIAGLLSPISLPLLDLWGRHISNPSNVFWLTFFIGGSAAMSFAFSSLIVVAARGLGWLRGP